MSHATPSAATEFCELIGVTTRWGRYLAQKENGIIVRGLDIAGAPGKAVDLGCGGGRWSKVLADRGWGMTCVDIDENSLRSCQQKIPSATCIRVAPTDTRIPCTDKSLELVLCMEAPDVIERDWFAPEARRVLKDGGYVIGFYMNRHSWRGMAWDPARSVNGNVEKYYTGPAYRDWKRTFRTQGFAMLHEESYAWPPFGRTSDSPLIPLATTIERMLGLKHLIRFAPWILFVAQKREERAGV